MAIEELSGDLLFDTRINNDYPLCFIPHSSVGKS